MMPSSLPSPVGVPGSGCPHSPPLLRCQGCADWMQYVQAREMEGGRQRSVSNGPKQGPRRMVTLRSCLLLPLMKPHMWQPLVFLADQYKMFSNGC